ncbi:MAG: autotransporter domain-containing protein [Rhabdochlamydiaceae bacterium]|nr:autotransporter domain-containing protein [Rhabdochlamydiaceae bacterium]
MVKFGSLLAVSLLLASTVEAVDSIWTPGTTTNWNLSTNWTPNHIPNAASDTATFNQSTPSTTISLASNSTINSLTFNTTTPYTISDATETLSFSGSAPSINVLSGNHTLNIGMHLLFDTALDVNPGSSITFGANTQFPTSQSLIISGDGNIFFQPSTSPYLLTNLIFNGGNTTNTNTNTQPTAFSQIIINSGKVENTLAGFFGNNAALFIMNGGEVINRGTLGSFVSAEAIINGGVLYNLDGGLAFPDAALVTINGGTIFMSNSSAALASSGGGTKLVMNGGTIFSSNNTLIAQDSIFEMNGGVIYIDQGIMAGLGPEATINGGTIYSNNGTFAFLSSPLTINGGAFYNQSASFLFPLTTSINGGLLVNSATFSTNSITLNGGTLDNAGTISVTNAFIQGGSGTYITEVGSTTSFGSLSANTLSLNGTFGAGALPGFNVEPGQAFVIITAPGGYTGRFSEAVSINLPDLLPVLTYGATEISLSFSPTLFSYPNIGEALFASVNHVNIGLSRRMDRLHGFMNRPSTNPAISYLAEPSELLASAAPDILAWGNRFNPEVEQKREEVKQAVTSPEQIRKLNVYAGPLGSLGTVSSKGEQVGYSYTSVGGLIGVDYAFNKVGLGVLVDYEFIDADLRRHWGDFDVNQIHGSIYATYAPFQEFAINSIIGGSYDWYHIDRKTGLLQNRVKAKGSPNGAEFDALLGAEYTRTMRNTQVMPYVNAQYIFAHIDSYHEHGAGLFNLDVSSQKAKSLRSMLGMRVNHNWKQTNFSFKPELNVAWQREFLDKNHSITVSPLQIVGPSNSVTLVKSGRNTGLVGLNLLFTFFDRYGFEVNYDYEWNKRFQDHFFFAGFNIRF